LYYDGVVLTDDLEMHAIIDHYGIGDASVQAIQAGCDMPLICKDRNRVVAAFNAVEKAATSGDLSEGRLAQSFARIRRLKERFLRSYRPVTISDARLVVGCRSHRALLRSIHQARERLGKPEV
jgi:beta-N-acetylhexosaminidase